MSSDAVAAHRSRVEAVAQQLRSRASASGPVHVDKGGVHHVVPLPGDQRFETSRVDASGLTHIIEIDAARRVAVCEPGVTFETLLRATLAVGLMPTVVPELRGITVGGAVAGCSVEAMSFRYGGFHDSCLRYEVVGGDGTVHELGPDDDADLFHHVHGSYGTLGVLALVEAELVPATGFVEVTYRHYGDLGSYERALAEACDLAQPDGPDFVDGIVFGPDDLVLCLGRFVESPPSGREPSDYTGVDIYYRSVRTLDRDVMTTEQYCFRYDAECHWLTRTVPPLEWRWVRRLAGRRLLGSTNLITWSNRLAPVLRRVRRRPDVVCDVFIPGRRLGEFFDWYRTAFDFWPLWVVPYRPPVPYPWIGPTLRDQLDDGELFIDLAVYGARNTDRNRDLSVELEEQVFGLGGIKTLIGRNHYDRDRFWTVYDRDAYVAAKSRLDPTGAFPDLYDKLGRV